MSTAGNIKENGMKYTVLRGEADDDGRDLHVVCNDLPTKKAARKLAKKLREKEIKNYGSWSDRFFVGVIFEEV